MGALTLPEIVEMGDRIKAHLGANDFVIASLGAHGPNADMPDGGMVATVLMGGEEATATAKYLHDAVALARGIIVRKREAEVKRKADEKAKAVQA